jgi:hypothetical protein
MSNERPVANQSAAIRTTSEGLDQHPAGFGFVILRQRMCYSIEFPNVPAVLLAVSDQWERLPVVKPCEARRQRKFRGVFAHAFIDYEHRQVFSMEVFACRFVGFLNDGTVLQAESIPRTDIQCLTAVMDAVPATEQGFHRIRPFEKTVEPAPSPN